MRFWHYLCSTCGLSVGVGSLCFSTAEFFSVTQSRTYFRLSNSISLQSTAWRYDTLNLAKHLSQGWAQAGPQRPHVAAECPDQSTGCCPPAFSHVSSVEHTWSGMWFCHRVRTLLVCCGTRLCLSPAGNGPITFGMDLGQFDFYFWDNLKDSNKVLLLFYFSIKSQER